MFYFLYISTNAKLSLFYNNNEYDKKACKDCIFRNEVKNNTILHFTCPNSINSMCALCTGKPKEKETVNCPNGCFRHVELTSGPCLLKVYKNEDEIRKKNNLNNLLLPKRNINNKKPKIEKADIKTEFSKIEKIQDNTIVPNSNPNAILDPLIEEIKKRCGQRKKNLEELIKISQAKSTDSKPSPQSQKFNGQLEPALELSISELDRNFIPDLFKDQEEHSDKTIVFLLDTSLSNSPDYKLCPLLLSFKDWKKHIEDGKLVSRLDIAKKALINKINNFNAGQKFLIWDSSANTIFNNSAADKSKEEAINFVKSIRKINDPDKASLQRSASFKNVPAKNKSSNADKNTLNTQFTYELSFEALDKILNDLNLKGDDLFVSIYIDYAKDDVKSLYLILLQKILAKGVKMWSINYHDKGGCLTETEKASQLETINKIQDIIKDYKQ